MNNAYSVYAAEAVGAGHPDKIADLIADKILDACLAEDPETRAAIEVVASRDRIYVSGELTTTAYLGESDFEEIVWEALEPLGYERVDLVVTIDLGHQAKSLERITKVGRLLITPAGDQSISYGYATGETENGMPIEHNLAHQLIAKAGEAKFG